MKAVSKSVVAGHRSAAQSALTGLDRVLRAIRSIGAVSSAAVRQSAAGSLGDKKVQALPKPQGPGEQVFATSRNGAQGFVCALEPRYDWRVCLMGAG